MFHIDTILSCTAPISKETLLFFLFIIKIIVIIKFTEHKEILFYIFLCVCVYRRFCTF